MIKLSQVSKTYQNHIKSLHDISFDIDSGQVVYLLGESGSGKSTLIKTIAGLIDSDEGTVHVNNEKITGPKHNLVPGYESIAYVSQNYKLQSYWSVEDNIGKKISFLPDEERRQRILEWLALFQLESYAESMPGELSGGQQQRVAIAAAVIDLPPVILLDEPFSNLDLPMKARMRCEMIEILRVQGTTIMLISHDPAEAMAVADQILLLREGRIEQMDTPEKLYHSPISYYAASFLGPVNELSIDGELKLVRPENIMIDDHGQHNGTVIESVFMGMHFGIRIESSLSSTGLLTYAKMPFDKGQKVNFIIG